MRRILVATFLSLAALAIALVLLLGDLPDPVATHFGPTGAADGFSDRSALLATTLGIPAILALVLGALVGSVQRNLPTGTRWIRGLPVGIVWGIGGIMLATLLPQRGLADAADATIPGGAVLLGLASGLVATLVAGRLVPASDPPDTSAPAPGDLPRAHLDADSTALWQGVTPTGRFALWMGTVLVLAGVVAGILLAWWVGVLLVATGLLPVANARFTVTIGPASVQVAGWLGGWPRLEVPMATVASADTSTMRAFTYGGPGLRLAVGKPITAVVTGTGPAIDLVRTDDSVVRINLDQAARAAEVVNALLDRRGNRAPTDTSPNAEGSNGPR